VGSLSHRYCPFPTSIRAAQLIGAVECTRLGVIFHMIDADDVLTELHGITVACYPFFYQRGGAPAAASRWRKVVLSTLP
jgi:hypothetical protein